MNALSIAIAAIVISLISLAASGWMWRQTVRIRVQKRPYWGGFTIVTSGPGLTADQMRLILLSVQDHMEKKR